MAKIWEHRTGYTAARYYVDFISRTGFSSLKIYGKENIPKDGAIMFAPNHCAALLDPLMLLHVCNEGKRPIGFGARADIFRNPFIASIMRWLRILPLARERDGLSEVAKNYAIFDEIADCLDHDVPFCMYAEGTHRAQRGMLPVKKGIFKVCKIADGVLQKSGRKLYVVPVGVNYEYFFRQMGRVEIHIGKPMDISAEFAAQGNTPEGEFLLSLRKRLQAEISALIDVFPKKDEKRYPVLLRALAAIVSLPLFVSCASASMPIWGIAELIMLTFKDKAWTHTVYFACRALMPLLLPFYWVAALLFNFYCKLIKDIKK